MRTQALFLTILIFITMTSVTNDKDLSVTSSAFLANSIIPAKYSCEGDEASPPLHINNVPTSAKSLALIVHDPDAQSPGGFTHWVVWNIDTTSDIPENYKGGSQGLNGAMLHGYKGMCPPSGTHHYHFMVYALDTKLDIDKNTDKHGLEKAMKGHIISHAELIGLYKKTK